jgi:hypothetical protein
MTTSRGIFLTHCHLSRLLALGLCWSGCSSDTSPSVLPASATKEINKSSNRLASLDPRDPIDLSAPESGRSSSLLPSAVTFVDADYEVKVETPTVPMKNPCIGHIKLKINVSLDQKNSAQLLEIPEGSFTCGALGSLNILMLLKALSGNAGGQLQESLTVANNVIGLKKLGDASYSPARPMFPSFLAGKSADLTKLDVTQSAITMTTPAGTSTGSFRIKMNSFDQTVAAPGTDGKELRRVMDFTLSSTGFENVDRITSFIFKSANFRMNLYPVALLSLQLSTTAEELADTGSKNSGSVDGLLKTATDIFQKDPTGLLRPIAREIPVKIAINLVRQDKLDELIANSDKNNAESLGEKFGR